MAVEEAQIARSSSKPSGVLMHSVRILDYKLVVLTQQESISPRWLPRARAGTNPLGSLISRLRRG